MQVSRFNTISDPKYIVGDCLLPKLISTKDLLVTIDNKLNFIAHMFLTLQVMHIYVPI